MAQSHAFDDDTRHDASMPVAGDDASAHASGSPPPHNMMLDCLIYDARPTLRCAIPHCR